MMFRAHVAAGVSVYFVAVVPIAAWIMYRQSWSVDALGQHWWEILICFALCVLGAMVPDINTESKSRRIIYTILVPVDLALILGMYYREAAIVGFFGILQNAMKHRGKLHARLSAIVLPAPLLILPILATGKLEFRQLGVSYYLAAVFGYASHLIADMKGRER